MTDREPHIVSTRRTAARLAERFGLRPNAAPTPPGSHIRDEAPIPRRSIAGMTLNEIRLMDGLPPLDVGGMR